MRPNFKLSNAELSYDSYGSHFSPDKKLWERESILRDQVPAQSSVLIIGCGTSLLPMALREKGCAVTVSDIAQSSVDFYKQKGFDGFVLDLETFGDIEGSYDVIIASEVLEHIKNPERAVTILKKHTKRFLICNPNSAFYRHRLQMLLCGRFLIQWKYHPAEHIRFWSHTDFLDWLAALGLKTEAVLPAMGFRCMGLLPFMKDLWPNLFANQIIYDCVVERG